VGDGTFKLTTTSDFTSSFLSYAAGHWALFLGLPILKEETAP